ncbi:MAG TPA: hypothetical protein P5123_02580 [Spirochaetota bacterium]|nr:hypothetical protein [Spirochaetota bacterium]
MKSNNILNIRLFNKVILFVIESTLGILYLGNKLHGFIGIILGLAVLALFIFNKTGFFPPYKLHNRKRIKH